MKSFHSSVNDRISGRVLTREVRGQEVHIVENIIRSDLKSEERCFVLDLQEPKKLVEIDLGTDIIRFRASDRVTHQFVTRDGTLFKDRLDRIHPVHILWIAIHDPKQVVVRQTVSERHGIGEVCLGRGFRRKQTEKQNQKQPLFQWLQRNAQYHLRQREWRQ